MKCPSCGYLRLEPADTCPRCGQTSMPGPGPYPLGRGLAGLSLEQDPAEEPATAGPGGGRGPDAFEEFAHEVESIAADPGPPGGEFELDDDLIPPSLPAEETEAGADLGLSPQAAGPETELRAPRLPAVFENRMEPGFAEVTRRAEDVPGRFWAPEGARLPRRAAALLADQAVLALGLVPFLLGAYAVLRASGFEPGQVLSPAALRAATPPLLLLAALLSLGYHTLFHGWFGSTPGKAIAGIEVRTLDGGRPSWGRALVRWLAALVALAPAGAGFAWAIFDRRRRGLADVLSGTVLGERRR